MRAMMFFLGIFKTGVADHEFSSEISKNVDTFHYKID